MVGAGVLLENVLQLGVDAADVEIGRIAHARGDLVNGERPEDRRMDRVLVVVDLG